MDVRISRNFERQELIVWTERDLTSDEKSKLDSLIAGKLEPEEVYQFGPIDLESKIEKAIGVRPVRVIDHPDVARTVIFFDKALTAAQERALEAFLKGIKAGFLKKRAR